MYDYILNGGLYIKPDFFDVKDFLTMKDDLDELEYNKTYQPSGVYYGNRLQAFPCYELSYNKFKNKTLNILNHILKEDITDLNIFARKTIMSEVRQSKSYDKYGFIHRDVNENEKPLIAGMMYFDQSNDGGTAFFRNHWDKVPDINIGAFPNRMIMYSGHRWHAPSIDYTFEERKTLSFFITTDKK